MRIKLYVTIVCDRIRDTFFVSTFWERKEIWVPIRKKEIYCPEAWDGLNFLFLCVNRSLAINSIGNWASVLLDIHKISFLYLQDKKKVLRKWEIKGARKRLNEAVCMINLNSGEQLTMRDICCVLIYAALAFGWENYRVLSRLIC